MDATKMEEQNQPLNNAEIHLGHQRKNYTIREKE